MIENSNLSFGNGRKMMFSDMNLNLAPGSICGLIGKNGSRKTTLLAGLRSPHEVCAQVIGHEVLKRAVGFLQYLIFTRESFAKE